MEGQTPPDIQLNEPLSFSKGMPVLRIAMPGPGRPEEFGTLLFDLEADPEQTLPLDNPEMERRMISYLVELMQACDAPAEQYARLGLR